MRKKFIMRHVKVINNNACPTTFAVGNLVEHRGSYFVRGISWNVNWTRSRYRVGEELRLQRLDGKLFKLSIQRFHLPSTNIHQEIFIGFHHLAGIKLTSWAPKYWKYCAKPSLSQVELHHFVVTRLPIHWCSNSWAITSVIACFVLTVSTAGS